MYFRLIGLIAASFTLGALVMLKSGVTAPDLSADTRVWSGALALAGVVLSGWLTRYCFSRTRRLSDLEP